MKKIAIYCFYSSKGKICKETIKQIQDLRQNTNYLILVINGNAENVKDVNCVDRVIKRENVGLDAGAYKHVLFLPDIKKKIQEYDQLILCNSTFFGPFIGFRSVFEEMAKRKVDFWGFSYFDNNFLKHIQSYLLVFNKNIIKDECFWNYWREIIDSSCTELREVCYWFENGLFDMLSNKYTFGIYKEDIDCNIYQYPDKCLDAGLPILKKKIFKDERIDRQKILCAFKLIAEHYDYPIYDILSEVMEEYGINLSIKEIMDYRIPEVIFSEKYPICKKTKDDLKNFARKKEHIYIFGTGDYAYFVYEEIKECTEIDGFIVSDDRHRKNTEFLGRPVFTLDEIKEFQNINVVIGLAFNNACTLQKKLKCIKNSFSLWE